MIKRMIVVTFAVCIATSYSLLSLFIYRIKSTPEQHHRVTDQFVKEQIRNRWLPGGSYYRSVAEKLQAYSHNPEIVVQAYQKALVKSPADYEVWYAYTSYLMKRQCCEALIVRLFSEITRRAPTDPDSYLTAGSYFLSIGHREEGLRQVRRSLELDARNGRSVYAALEKRDLAINELLQVTPETPEALISLANYLKSKGKKDKEKLDQVLRRLEKLPMNDDQKLQLSDLAAEAGYFSLAKEKALQVHGAPDIEGRKFQLLADIAARENDWAAFSQYSTIAIQKYRTSNQQERAVRYALQVVFKLSKVEQWGQTRERLQKVIQDFPDEADGYYQLAKWIEKDSPQLSLQYLENARELDPKNFVYADLLAGRYIALSRYPEAEKIYRRFLEDKRFQNKAYLRIITVKILQGESSDAESLMEEAASKGGQSERFLIEMAKLYEKTGDYRKAAETYQQLAALRPGRSDSYLISAGKAYTKAGDREAARSQYLQVLEIDPENTRARQGLAELK